MPLASPRETWHQYPLSFVLHVCIRRSCCCCCFSSGGLPRADWSLSLLVDADEIRRLGKRFKKLDVDGSGSLSVQEFMSIPELQQNPLVQRVIDIFDTDGNGEIDFKGKSRISMVESTVFLLEFIGGISQFSVKGDKESKLRCKRTDHFECKITTLLFLLVAFKIYDMDKDGFISNGKTRSRLVVNIWSFNDPLDHSVQGQLIDLAFALDSCIVKVSSRCPHTFSSSF